MKKEKKIIRIVASVLVVIMVLGLIVPYVMAAEIDETEAVVESALAELPDGFEYVQNGESLVINKTANNNKPAIALDVDTSTFDVFSVTVFVGNLVTHGVTCYELYKHEGYVKSIDLADGYYVIFANDYAWSDSNDNAYAINGNEYKYIYIGDDYDPNLYGVEFETTDDIFRLSMVASPDSMYIIGYNNSLMFDESDMQYPEGAKLKKLADTKENKENEPKNDGATTPSVDSEQEKEDGDKNRINVWSMLLNSLKRSAFLISAIVICYISLTVIRYKKRKEVEEQAENDKYDDKRVE